MAASSPAYSAPFGPSASVEPAEPLARPDRPDDPALGGRSHAQRLDEIVEQAHVAKRHAAFREAERRQSLEAQAQDLRVGGGPVGAADRLDAGLEELAALARPHAEDRPAIAVAAGLGPVPLEVHQADGDGVFGPQAQFPARRILGREQAPADILPRQFDERLRRLKHRRLDARVPLALEERDQRPGGLTFRHGRRSFLVRPVLFGGSRLVRQISSGMLSSNGPAGWRTFSGGRVNGGRGGEGRKGKE